MNLHNIDPRSLLPAFLKDDETAIALCEALRPEFDKAICQSGGALLFANIDILNERVLDELAYEFHADLYDYTDPIDIKRETLKQSVRIHKHAGTAYAVKTALTSVYKDAVVEEWFNYGRSPYTFRVRVKSPSFADEAGLMDLYRKIVYVVERSKNARSHLDGIGLYYPSTAPLHIGVHTRLAQHVTICPYMPPPVEQVTQTTIGAWMKVGQRVKILCDGALI